MPNCAATWATTAATFHVDTYETTLGDTLVDCARLSNATTCRAAPLGAFVFRPRCDAGGCPSRVAAVLAHRGGYESNAPCASCFDASLARHLARRGVTVVSVAYRLEKDRGHAPAAWVDAAYANRFGNGWVVSPPAMYAATRDLRAAARWARATNFSCVLAAGSSAGATSALALAALGDDAYGGGADAAVDGAIAVHGTTDGVDCVFGEGAWRSGDGRPVLAVHGDADDVNDVANSRWIAAHYGGSATLVELPGAGHKLRGDAFEAALEAAVAWLPTAGVALVDARPDAGAAVDAAAWSPASCGADFEPLCAKEDKCFSVGDACLGALELGLVAALAASLALVAVVAARRRRRRTIERSKRRKLTP